MPNIGVWEIVIVVVIALLVFGPKKLPELGSSLGRSINGFKQGLRESKEDDAANAVKDTTAADKPTGSVATTTAADEATSIVQTGAKAEQSDDG